MDEQHIKSRDLCERCKYDEARWCDTHACSSCAQEDLKAAECRCNSVKFGTPCPWFAENEDLA